MNLGKKLIIGSFVAGVFVVYSLGIRHEQPVIAKPLALAGGSSPGATSTATPSSTGSPPSTSTPANTPNSSTGTSTPQATPSGQYKDGTYTGSVANAYYGNVQVKATVSGGKLTNVTFLQYPDTHSTSVYINQQAMPYLQQEAIQAQNANVQIISGATFTSQAFQQSLSSALSQA